MQKLIEGLLAYSRLGTRGTEMKPVNMNDVYSSAVANLTITIAENGANVTRDDLPTITGDQTLLIQLLQNLIANAIKFRRADVSPSVNVSGRREGEEWIFSVADNGIGISPDHFEKIFQIFQRLHTQEEYPGMGIGLSLCKRIVERHQGRIWVESTPNERTTFFFVIPVMELGELRGRLQC